MHLLNTLTLDVDSIDFLVAVVGLLQQQSQQLVPPAYTAALMCEQKHGDTGISFFFARQQPRGH